ncbi:MAG TPA: right-handed parallel beta-helix repeat-containing protein [Candidatus Limnocylindrales bacterium]
MRVSPHRLAKSALIGLVAAMATVLLAAPVAAASPPGLYVAKNHSSDANPCSTSQPCLTIGHAVSVAAAGATIHVGNGTYAEQVSITQQLTLIGDHTIIDATGQNGGIQPLAGMGVVGYGLLIFGPGASGSVVKGFTVEHAIGEGILVAGTSKVLIQNNIVRLNDAGFNTTMTLECQAQGNVPGDCGEGLHLVSSTWSRLVGNLVENNIGGILITDEFGPSAHNVISGNVSKNNLQDCGITLPSHNALAMTDPTKGGVYDNLVINNVSEGNGGAGVGMFAPFPGTASYNNRIIHNTLRNNGEAGVGIHAHAPGQNVSGNVIMNNWISGNGIDPDSGSGHPTGIALFSAAVPVTVAVTDNHISNEYWGIFTAGPLTIHGLPSNHYASSVTKHIN